MHWSFWIVTVFLVLAFNRPAFAASEVDRDQCKDVNNAQTADRNIAACERIVNDRNESQANHAIAFANRCGLWKTKGEADRAMADCNQAIRLNPKFALAYNNRENAWQAKGDSDRAITDYIEAIRLDPKYAVAYNNRGLAYYNKKDFDRALADYDQAIRLDPKYAAAYNNRGLVWYNKKDYDRAIAKLYRLALPRRHLSSASGPEGRGGELRINAQAQEVSDVDSRDSRRAHGLLHVRAAEGQHCAPSINVVCLVVPHRWGLLWHYQLFHKEAADHN
jgi:lipoprotein NlpI